METEKEKCPVCDGRGYYLPVSSGDREWADNPKDDPCDECNGTGEVEIKCPQS